MRLIIKINKLLLIIKIKINKINNDFIHYISLHSILAFHISLPIFDELI
jgi:hypothetical protein